MFKPVESTISSVSACNYIVTSIKYCYENVILKHFGANFVFNSDMLFKSS